MRRPSDPALSAALDAAEREYRSALDRGDPDPVVLVTRPGPADPDSLELTVHSRADLIGSLSTTHPAVAEILAEGAGSPCLLTIVVQTPRGISTIDRRSPRTHT